MDRARNDFIANSLAFDRPVTGTVNFIKAAMGTTTIVIAVLTVVLLLIAVQSIRVSVSNIGGIAQRLADGDIEKKIEAYDCSLSFGGLCKSLEEFRVAAMRQRRLETESREAEEKRAKAEKEAEAARVAAMEEQQRRDRDIADQQAKRTNSLEELIAKFDSVTEQQFSQT